MNIQNDEYPQVSKIHPLKKKLLPKKQTTEYNAGSGNPGSYQKGGYGVLNRIIVKGSLHVTPQGIYHIKYRIIDPVKGASKSKTKSTGFRAKDNTKRKAEQYMKDFFSELEEQLNAVPVVEPENPLFSECVNAWLENKKCSVSESTLKGYKIYANKHIIPMLGDIRLRDLTVQKLQTAYNKLTEVISPNTVHKLHVVVSGALEDAEVAGLIPYNYAARVKLPKKKRFEGTAYNKAQVKTLLAAAEEAGEPIRSAVVLGAIYGLRKSEACGLRWKDIDFEQGTMYIRNTVKTNGSLIVEEERTKTKKSRRMIALIPFTVPYFKELKETQERAGLTLDKVCVWPDGRRVRTDYLSKQFDRLIEKAGLPKVRYHDLRDTAASLLASTGDVTLKQLQDFMGHEDIATTMNIYVHVLDGEKQAASEAMDAIFSNENL